MNLDEINALGIGQQHVKVLRFERHIGSGAQGITEHFDHHSGTLERCQRALAMRSIDVGSGA
ncbi:MAG: hypothetical protein Q8R10_00410 [Pseudomonas sp.]|uniref:hypothetical protein n=1 Tax=Pseudomonas sp. TaxID=306 RepID=UPI0027377206|nr:hypothetical protein [Pseudomonas sp.]MDP3844882.1 hypothetical protein [Pseudomonas sp.]